jgi:hypothetical protein
VIARRISGRPTSTPFRYFDKGNMAVVGAGFAVLQTGKIRMNGLLAWLAWGLIHLQFLAQSSERESVLGIPGERERDSGMIPNGIPGCPEQRSGMKVNTDSAMKPNSFRLIPESRSA